MVQTRSSLHRLVPIDPSPSINPLHPSFGRSLKLHPPSRMSHPPCILNSGKRQDLPTMVSIRRRRCHHPYRAYHRNQVIQTCHRIIRSPPTAAINVLVIKVWDTRPDTGEVSTLITRPTPPEGSGVLLLITTPAIIRMTSTRRIIIPMAI